MASFAWPRPSYFWLALSVAILALISHYWGADIVARMSSIEDAPSAPVLAALVLFALCSFVSFYTTLSTPIPSFVAAVAFGIAGHELFAPIVADRVALSSIVPASAAIILFSGGLEISLRQFMRLLVKIVLLAVPGVILTAFVFSLVVGALGRATGIALAPAVVILLGAILASTDPAAIIPVTQHLRFKRRAAKDIVIAESAVNDVVGALLTTAFLKLPLAAMTVLAAYQALVTPETVHFMAAQATFGVVFGVAAYALLWMLAHLKRNHVAHYGADQIYFLVTPLMAFTGALVFGGSGFLAAFVAGLMFKVDDYIRKVEHFFYQVIDGVAKPSIFLLVGALVDVHALIVYAPVGIVAALIFMFVLRPAMVFMMLGLYTLLGNDPRGLSRNELLFISFVRETGAIPAVLLVTAIARMTTPVDGLIEVGMWVILMTLAIGPPLTPWVARRLGVAE